MLILLYLNFVLLSTDFTGHIKIDSYILGRVVLNIW